MIIFDLFEDNNEKSQGPLTVDQLATISDAALDAAYGYGRSSPGNTFGWQANLKSASFAKQMIDKGITDVEAISDAIHKGWNVTAQAFVKNPMQFDDSKTMAPEKLQAKLAQRQKLMTQQYAQLPEDEKEKDRVVARAMLQAITGEQGVAEAGEWPDKMSHDDLENMQRNHQKWSEQDTPSRTDPSATVEDFYHEVVRLGPGLGRDLLYFAAEEGDEPRHIVKAARQLYKKIARKAGLNPEIGSSDNNEIFDLMYDWVGKNYSNPGEQGVAEGTGPQSKLDQKIIHLLTNGIPADAIARKLDIPEEWVHEVAKYNMPDSAIDYNDPRNSTQGRERFGEQGVAETAPLARDARRELVAPTDRDRIRRELWKYVGSLDQEGMSNRAHAMAYSCPTWGRLYRQFNDDISQLLSKAPTEQLAQALQEIQSKFQDVAEGTLNELAGYSSDKAYQSVDAYKRYDVYVSRKKFNNIAFIAVAENPRTRDTAFKARGNTPQEAVNNLKAEIDREIDVATKVSGQATLDFNVDFVRAILELSSDTFYAKIVPGPQLVIAGSEMLQYPDIMKSEGFKPSTIRTSNSSEGTTPLPGVPLSPKAAMAANLIANGRYVLGNETVDRDGNRVFDLNFDSVVQASNDKMRLRAPAVTVGTNRSSGVTEMDKSQKSPAGWNLDDYDYSKGKWTRGKIVTAKDAVKDMGKELNRAFNNPDPKNKKPGKKPGVAESAGAGEYYIWTVHFANPEKNPPRRVRVYSDEFVEELEGIKKFYAKKGLTVVDVDTDTGLARESVAEGQKLARLMRKYVPGSFERQVGSKIKDQQFTQLIAKDTGNPINQKEIDQTKRNIRRLKSVGQQEVEEGLQSFYNGMQVKLTPEYADRPDEVFTVSHCDQERGRCWIGDEQGRGWSATFDQLIPVEDDDDESMFENTPKMSAREKLQRAVDREKKQAQQDRTGLAGMDYDQVQRQLRGIQDRTRPKKVDEDSDNPAVEQAIARRIMVGHTDLLLKYGPRRVMRAVEQVADHVGSTDEIGTSDVSGWVRQVEQALGGVSEAKATKTRLDPHCWTGKKIGTPKTKVKGGVRVNNCVPK